MTKKRISAAAPSTDGADARTRLGSYLLSLREAKRLTLREVEEATDKTVSNAYLSQLENSKILKPAPAVLHALALVYAIPYERLMEKAGYLTAESTPSGGLRSAGQRRSPRASAFAIADLTQEEEAKLLEYLAFLRSR